MKIGLYSTAQIPTAPKLKGYGGVEYTVGNLAKRFAKHGHEVHLFGAKGSYRPDGGVVNEFESSNPNEAILEREMFQSFDKSLFDDLDILHDNSHWHFPAALVPDVQYCYTLHATRANMQDFKQGYNYNGILQCTHHAIYQKWMTGNEYRVCQGGIDISHFKFKKDKGDRLLWLSRLFEPKGAHRAIEIAEMAKTPIDIVGGSFIDTPSYTNKIKRMCQYSDYANFVGEVSQKEKHEYLENAKALLFPVEQFLSPASMGISLWIEALCLVPLEALACGTPVIASPNGIISDAVHDGMTGYLAANDRDFVDRIHQIDNIDPQMCRCRAEYFSLDKTAERYLHLYKEIIEGRTW